MQRVVATQRQPDALMGADGGGRVIHVQIELDEGGGRGDCAIEDGLHIGLQVARHADEVAGLGRSLRARSLMR